ncbi:unnamed protein product [Ixodes pacificus]
MPDTSRTSVIKEIDKNQAAVHEYLFQLDQIETKLRRTNLSDEQRVALEDEVRTVKKQLDSLDDPAEVNDGTPCSCAVQLRFGKRARLMAGLLEHTISCTQCRSSCLNKTIGRAVISRSQ